MASNDGSRRWPVGAAAVLTLPAAAVLVLLALAEQLAWTWVVLAGTAVFVALLLLVRPYFAGIRGVQHYAEMLARADKEDPGTDPDPPAQANALPELTASIRRLHRQLAVRGAENTTALMRFEQVLDSLPEPLLTVDGESRVTTANAAARALLGARIVGLDLGAAVRTPEVRAASLAAIGEPGTEHHVEFSIPVPVERAFRARIVALAEDGSDTHTVVILLEDLTRAKLIEEMRGDFVANVSHELRTPLASLIGYIETLRGPAAKDEAAREQFLGIMEQQSARMSRLVDDLLSLSAIELTEHSPPTDRVELLPLLRGTLDTLRPRTQARRIDVEIVVAEACDATPTVPGDPDQLAEVFENLIDNAVKYSPHGSRVTVTLGAANNPGDGSSLRYRVSVADNGPGIPSQHLPRLTERFYRVDPARSRELGGTGLGLAIVKHILNRHGGSLSIDSEPGIGSTFTHASGRKPTLNSRAYVAAMQQVSRRIRGITDP